MKQGSEAGKVPVVYFEAGRVMYALQPKQHEVYRLTPLRRGSEEPYSRHIGCGGAGGGGKSYLARAVLAAVALLWPGSTAILFRRTEREVKENHVVKFRSEVPERDPRTNHRLYTWNGGDLIASWFNGSRTLFGYLKNEDDVFAYQGPEYDAMIFEESTHYSDFQVRWLTGNRLRATTPRSRPFALYPSNPGNRGHQWYKRLFIERRYHEEAGEKAEDYAFVQMFLRDNQELMRRDPGYGARLDTLPEPWRSWQRDGNFSAGAGTALVELNEARHMVAPFEIPQHWLRFGSFDWGYEHPFSFGFYAASEDGRVFKTDTVTGRHLQPYGIAEKVRAADLEAVNRLKYISAGHDCWAEVKSRGENVPTIAEQFGQMGLYLTRANISRVSGLQQLRAMLSPATTGDGTPLLQFFETPGNRRCFTQLEDRVTDPDDPEDVLKTDADLWGEGGDDMYDECVLEDTVVYTLRGPQPIGALVGTVGWLFTGSGQAARYHSVRCTNPCAPVYKLRLVDGRTVVGTAIHPVATPQGWRWLGSLHPGDTILDAGSILRYITRHDEAHRAFPEDPGIPRSALLADEDGLLPPAREVAAPGSVGGQLRTHSGGASYSPQRWGPRQQPAGKPDGDSRARSPSQALASPGQRAGAAADAGTLASDSTQGAAVAPLESGSRGAQSDCVPDLGTGTVEVVPVRGVRARVSLQGTPAPTSPLLWSALSGATPTAEVASVEPIGWAPVYNLEVIHPSHSFIVNRGLIVHNCRYAAASRPWKVHLPPPPEITSTFSPEILLAESERLRRGPPDKRARPAALIYDHPEFGDYM